MSGISTMGGLVHFGHRFNLYVHRVLGGWARVERGYHRKREKNCVRADLLPLLDNLNLDLRQFEIWHWLDRLIDSLRKMKEGAAQLRYDALTG
jgi:hypothetical protein